jgi:serine phosphatase RsbU (regulator of sigma subunit)
MEVWGGNEATETSFVLPGLDAWIFARPYAHAAGGGDVHYVSSCATGRVTRLMVADVAGHGSPVAEIARALRTLMRRYVNFLDQTHLVRSLNREFAQLADLGTFATAVVATYWAPTGHLVTCNAGHPRPLLYRARTNSWQLLKSPGPARDRGPGDDTLSNLPLGIAEPTGYDQYSLRLSPGDLVLLYTDSFIESRDAAAGGNFLTEDGLLALAATLDASNPAAFIPALVSAVERRAGSTDLADDVTALLLRHSGTQPPNALLRGLAAPFRIARASVMRLRLGPDAPAPFPEVNIANIFGAIVPALSRFWRPRAR